MKEKALSDPKAERARQRATVILQVRSGQITATDAAQQLGVSRKTYYQWEERALTAMMHALEDRPGGRPAMPSDPEKEALTAEKERLEQELLVHDQTLKIRQALAEWEARDGDRPKKNR